MPRPRQSTVKLTPGQACYVLDRMIAERRVSAGEVSRYVGDMQREIGELERRLQSLRAASGGGGAAPAVRGRRGRPPAAQKGAAVAAPRKRRRRAAITPEQLASRQLQGRYLGLIRQIPASKRGQYQKIAKDKGREAAIKEMTSALKK